MRSRMSVNASPLERGLPGSHRVDHHADGPDDDWGVVDHVARHHFDWDLPAEQTPATWREAQIFAGVSNEFVEAINLDPTVVVRSDRLGPDLGMA